MRRYRKGQLVPGQYKGRRKREKEKEQKIGKVNWPLASGQRAVDRSVGRNDKYNFLYTDLSTVIGLAGL